MQLCNATSPAPWNFKSEMCRWNFRSVFGVCWAYCGGVEGGVKINRALEVRDCSANGELGKVVAEMGEE